MAYNANKPQPNDTISTSQADLLANFQAIKTLLDVDHATFGSATEGKHPILHIPQQTTGGSIPAATSVTEYGLYVATDGANPALWIRQPNQTAGTVTGDINITSATKSTNGECYLPCGIRLKWGYGSLSGGSQTVSGTFAGTALAHMHNIIFSRTGSVSSSYDAKDYNLSISGTTSGWTLTRSSSYTGAPISIYYLAIGD